MNEVRCFIERIPRPFNKCWRPRVVYGNGFPRKLKKRVRAKLRVRAYFVRYKKLDRPLMVDQFADVILGY